MSSCLLSKGAALAVLLGANAASASLLVHDPVRVGSPGYSAASLRNQSSRDGTTGYASGGFVDGSDVFQATATGLSYPANIALSAEGGSFTVFSTDTSTAQRRNVTRSIEPIATAAGNTVYMSLLARAEDGFFDHASTLGTFGVGLGLFNSGSLSSGQDSGTPNPHPTGFCIGFGAGAGGQLDLVAYVMGTRVAIMEDVARDQTYFVVARIDLTGAGNDTVRFAVDPVAPEDYINAATTTKTILPQSDTFKRAGMSGTYSVADKHAWFDELRVGTTWWDVAPFSTMAAPFITALPPVKTAATSAILGASLLYHNLADVTLYWDTDPAPAAWANSTNLGAKAMSTFSVEIAGLDIDTEYYYYFAAADAVTSDSEVLSFRTRGAAEFGAPVAVTLANAVKFSVPLEPGASLEGVRCWISATESDLLEEPITAIAPARTWTQNFPAVPTCSTNAAAGATFYARFEAYGTLPTSGAAYTVWSGIVPATVGVREVLWSGAVTKNWDTLTANWRDSNNAAALFENGNFARFDITATAAALTLAEDIETSGMDLTIRNTVVDNNTTYGSWSLAGADKSLTLYGDMVINDFSSSTGNAIDTPRISGDGGVALNSGRFRLGNSANDFTGGATILSGTLDATADGANATPLGSGPVRLGSTELVTAPATLGLNTSGGGGATFNLATLELVGDQNSTALTLSGSPLDVTIANLSRETPAATLQVTADAGSALAIANLLPGLQPPWLVSATGGYMQNDGGVLSAITDYAGFDIFTAASLSESTNVAAARVAAGTLALNNNTLALGGLSLGNSTVVSGGTLDIGSGEAFVHTPGGISATLSAVIAADIAGDATLVKFGPGALRLTGGQDPDLINQEGWLTLMPPADMVYNGSLTGSGNFLIRGGTITLPRADYDFNAMHVNYGGLIIENDTRVLHRGVFILGAHGQGVMQSTAGVSTMAIRDGARWTQGPGQEFIFGSAQGDHWTAHNQSLTISGVSAATGDPSMLDLNGGILTICVRANNNASTSNNRLTVADGAVITNAATIQLSKGQGGNGGILVATNGASVHTGRTLVGYRLGANNSITITGAATRWDNGNGVLHIAENNDAGSMNSNSVLIADHARMFNVNTVYVGYRSRDDRGGNVCTNSLVITGGAELRMSGGGVTIGGGKSGIRMFDNKLVLDDNGMLEVPGAIAVGHDSAGSHNNALVLSGGSATAATLAVAISNRLDVILGSAGLQPIQLTGNATFANDSYITPFCADAGKAGRYYPIIQTTDGTISTNGVIFNPSQPNLLFKLNLSADKKELSLGVFPQGTLLIIR